ncbi:MAG: phosphotyrosine protein phosphatase [Lysobacteraceae bacterium]|nr:MAG: phosphotyrosine protein phosphatase [Xanthomonadaceae bacterium]
MAGTVRILVVCMGNICRSPLAEGILRHHAQKAGLELLVDSAGTHAYHVGEPPDPRAVAVARQRGIDITGLRARQVEAADAERFDHVLVADRRNLEDLRRRQPAVGARARLLLEVAGAGGEVPDPYYGDERDFEAVFELLDRAAPRLLARLAADGGTSGRG